jgi:hypothetical protein
MRYAASQLNQEWAPNQADAEPSVEDMIERAKAKGYTRPVFATGDGYDLELWVKPDVDLDGTFRAYDEDEDEWVKVNGWLFVIEDRD